MKVGGTGFGELVHDGKRVKHVKRIGAPSVSLAFALEATLEFADLERSAFEDELAATSSHELGPIRGFLAARGSMLLSEVEDFAILEKRAVVENRNPSQTILGLVRENTSNPPAILYVSGMFGSIETIIELGWRMKHTYGVDL
jgi:hypothetical protein